MEIARASLWGRKARVFNLTSKPATIDAAFPHPVIALAVGTNFINKNTALCLRSPRVIPVKDSLAAPGTDSYFLFQYKREERLGLVRMSMSGAMQPVHIVQALYYGGVNDAHPDTVVALATHFYNDPDPLDKDVGKAIEDHARKFADAVHGFESVKGTKQMVPGGSQCEEDVGLMVDEKDVIKKSWCFSVVPPIGVPPPPGIDPRVFTCIFRRCHRLGRDDTEPNKMKVMRSHEFQLVSSTKKPMKLSQFIGAFRQLPFEQPTADDIVPTPEGEKSSEE